MKNTFTLIIILFVFTVTLKAQVSEQEFQALKALYNATGGNNWTDRSGWENINTTATKDDVTKSWKGIQRIVNGHITQLNFYNNNLSGTLPDEIGNLQYLTNFIVHFNKLQAPLPEALKTIKTLQTVNISANPLNITFPADFIISWPNLVNFDAFDCGLTGTIDDIFMHTPLLNSLSIAQNKLTGELPQSLNTLDFIEFDCKENDFTGTLPSLQNSIQTYRLNFSDNQFSGSIPDHYGTFNLQFLVVQYNNLSGEIPAGLFKAGFNELNIEENFYSFADIEPVFTQLNSLPQKKYSTTKKFPVSSTLITVNAGEPLTLDAVELSVYNLGGNNNRYKWFRNNVEIYSGNNPVLNISKSTTTDAGTYRFEVTNTVVAGVTLKSENIVVNVQSDNYPPTDIILSQTQVDENFRGVLGLLSAADSDTDDNHIFTLSTGDGTNDINNSSFTIEEGNQLYNWNYWNYEETKTLKINISVDDGNGGVFNKAFVITVNNVNEAPVYNGQLTSNTIDENAANGSTALTLMAQDPEGTPVVFSITAGNENGAFGIDGNKLIVADNSELDYDVKKQYNLSVRASDGELNTTAILIIMLNKINQMPVVENATFAIDENSPLGTVVGSIIATDREGDPLTYSILTGNELSAFRLNGNTIVVDNSDVLNYEEHPVFNLTVNVSDGISNVQATVTVNLSNVSENTDNDIVSFSVPGMEGEAIINETAHTIQASVRDVDLSALVAVFSLSNEATSSPISGTILDFTTPKTITVTAQSGDMQEWVITVTMLVGTNNLGKAAIRFFPNPVQNILNLSGTTYGDRINLFSLSGKRVLEIEALGNNEQIDISRLTSGAYLLTITSNKSVATYKITKQ